MDRLILPEFAGRMTNNRNDTVLVLGGTGKTGRRVAERLNKAAVSIRIGSRSAEMAFDWTDRDTWEPAVSGISAVYLAYSPDVGFPGAADTVGSFARLAVESGVRRVVLLTGRGEEGAQRSEQLVQAAGAEWTIVRSSFFAQNFSEDFLAADVANGEIAFPAANVSEPFIDVEDLADIAFAALTENGHAGQTYEVTGPRLLTFPAAVAEIAAITGSEIRYLPISSAAFLTSMVDQGVDAEFAASLTALFDDVLDGRNSYLADGVERALRRPPRDFSDFVRRAAAGGAWDRSGVLASPSTH
jgi:uncharacterized protein YbjT (DUF2867 family)